MQRSLGMFSKIKDYLLTKDKEDLSSSGANGEASGGDGLRSILHQSTSANDLGTVKRLLKNKSLAQRKALVDAQDSNGWQPLHEAVRGKYLYEGSIALTLTHVLPSVVGSIHLVQYFVEGKWSIIMTV